MWPWVKVKLQQEQSELFKELGLTSAKLVKMQGNIDDLYQRLRTLRGFVNKRLKLDLPDPEEEKEDLEIPGVAAFNDGFDQIRKITKEAVKHGNS